MRSVTTSLVTQFGVTRRWRIEMTADLAAERSRVLVLVDGRPVQDLIVIGGTAWSWSSGEEAYTPRPFVEQALAAPAAPLADLALEEELNTEVVYVGEADVALGDGIRRVHRFDVLDSRPRDDDHSTGQYRVEVDADRLVRRMVCELRR